MKKLFLAIVLALLASSASARFVSFTCDADAQAGQRCNVSRDGQTVWDLHFVFSPSNAFELRDAFSENWKPTVVCTDFYGPGGTGDCSQQQVDDRESVPNPESRRRFANARIRELLNGQVRAKQDRDARPPPSPGIPIDDD